MSKSHFTNRTQQRGDALIEALIGMLLLAIIGLGLAYSTSRVSVSQKDMNVHNLVVSKLRAQLISGDFTVNNLVIGEETFTIHKHSNDVINDKISIVSDGIEVKVGVPMYSLSATKKNDSSYKICVGPIPCNN